MTDSFLSLPLQYDEKTKSVVCRDHIVPKCAKCGLDFRALNFSYRAFNLLDTPAPPPPNKRLHSARSAQIAKFRDSGNNSAKLKKYADAVRYFSLAIATSLSRPAWEAANICREETVIFLYQRSAARFLMKQYVESLCDAETVVQLKGSWPKGHVCKSRVLLAMGQLEEAKRAVEVGLMFNSNDIQLNLALKDISKMLHARS